MPFVEQVAVLTIAGILAVLVIESEVIDLDGYVIGWLVYGVSALVVCWLGWRISAGWRWRPLRTMVRMLLAVLLFTPVNIGTGVNWFAPAYLVGGYEAVLGNIDLAVDAMLNLSVGLAAGIGVLMLDAIVRKLLHLNEAN